MLKSAASKVMWVGRATVFLVGLAVILALVFGITSTAFAHRGDKGFFHLGHKNVKHAVSKLVGRVTGPSLVIGNGSEDPKATALRLNVKAGKPPMKVNSDAKVPKLNADKLDGLDSTEIGVNGLQTISFPTATNSSSPKSTRASCPSGKMLVGTGWTISGGKRGSSPDARTDVVVDSVLTLGNSVLVSAYEVGQGTTNSWQLSARATCAQAP